MTDDLKQAVLHKVLARLPEPDEAAALECVNRAEEYFLGRTKRKTVPMSAFYLWIDLALRMQKLSGGADSGGRVSSVKRGDTTIQYADGDNGGDAADLESRVLGYRVARCR